MARRTAFELEAALSLARPAAAALTHQRAPRGPSVAGAGFAPGHAPRCGSSGQCVPAHTQGGKAARRAASLQRCRNAHSESRIHSGVEGFSQWSWRALRPRCKPALRRAGLRLAARNGVSHAPRALFAESRVQAMPGPALPAQPRIKGGGGGCRPGEAVEGAFSQPKRHVFPRQSRLATTPICRTPASEQAPRDAGGQHCPHLLGGSVGRGPIPRFPRRAARAECGRPRGARARRAVPPGSPCPRQHGCCCS